MVKYGKEFGFMEFALRMFSDSSESLNSAILKNAVICPDEDICFKWAAEYQNFSTILNNILVQKFRAVGKWSNENNVLYLCALENCFVKTHGYVFIVRNGRHFMALINDVIFRVFESGLFTNIQKRSFDKQKLETKINSPTFTETYCNRRSRSELVGSKGIHIFVQIYKSSKVATWWGSFMTGRRSEQIWWPEDFFYFTSFRVFRRTP
jgi:hypothetical protein